LGIYANPRFQTAVEEAQAAWAAADPLRCADQAGCSVADGRVLVPFFGRPHTVVHPSGLVTVPSADDPSGAEKTAHVSIAILLLHYLLTADGTPPSGRLLAFRGLPGGMFYAESFAAKAEAVLARCVIDSVASVEKVEGLTREAAGLGGRVLDLADVSFGFDALPLLPMAVLLWRGDDEFAGEARILFDAYAHHYLPTEDLAGIGDWLAHRLACEW
jgi:hypothetical protein